ncbi:MAG: HAD family phosphatase [Clostridia bacterium]|nr:HAD family phosphatase [Clostridia bacterium]
MIKNIVFDMGGVLIDYNPEKTLYAVLDKESADIALAEIFRNKIWTEKDRGVVSAEEILAQRGSKIPARSYEKVAEMVMDFYPYMPPFPQAEEIVKRLKANGYRIFLLSNASMDFYDAKKNIPALNYFDGCLVSADYKLIKPEKEIYLTLFSKFNLLPGECFFIDDVEANCEASREQGMKAFRLVNQDYEGLINAFKENGIRI